MAALACRNRSTGHKVAHVHVTCPVCEESTLCFHVGPPERATWDYPGSGPSVEDFVAACGHEPTEAEFERLFTEACREAA